VHSRFLQTEKNGIGAIECPEAALGQAAVWVCHLVLRCRQALTKWFAPPFSKIRRILPDYEIKTRNGSMNGRMP